MQISTMLTFFSCYSAHEHTLLSTVSDSISNAQTSTSVPLPLDIKLETILSTLLLVYGLVLSTPKLKPIEWRLWAGEIERAGEKGAMDSEGVVDKGYVGNPYSMLESRVGFLDIRAVRKEFSDWVRDGEGANTKS